MTEKQIKRLAKIASKWKKDFEAVSPAFMPPYLKFKSIVDMSMFLEDAAMKIEVAKIGFNPDDSITSEAVEVVEILGDKIITRTEFEKFREYLK
jgi:hypothetical protein